MRKSGTFWLNRVHKLQAILQTRALTRQESRDLGRAEYWNPENIKGTSYQDVLDEKYIYGGGILDLWMHEFINGWYGATMLSDDEPDIVPDET